MLLYSQCRGGGASHFSPVGEHWVQWKTLFSKHTVIEEDTQIDFLPPHTHLHLHTCGCMFLYVQVCVHSHRHTIHSYFLHESIASPFTC